MKVSKQIIPRTKSLCKEVLSLTSILDSKFNIKFDKKKDELENKQILRLFINIRQVLRSDDLEYLSTAYKPIAFSSSDITIINCELADNEIKLTLKKDVILPLFSTIKKVSVF